MDGSGRVTGATVVSEDPFGWGFGDAAVRSVSGLAMVDAESGVPIARGTVRMTFSLGG